jgi:S-DNA-T family DNA segregation ATPase FtsK/SpoIIIE
MRKDRINEIWGVFFLLVGLFTLASLIFFHKEDLSFYTSHPVYPVQNYTGLIGAYIAFGLYLTFGLSALLIPVLFLLWSGCFFLQRVPEKKLFKFVGLTIALFSTSTLVAITVRSEVRFDQAGAVGYVVGSHLLRYFGMVGSYILAGSCLLLSLLLATDFLIYPIVKNLFESVQDRLKIIFGKVHRIAETIEEQQEARRQRQLEKSAAKPKPTPKNGKPEMPVKISVLPDVPLKVKKYEPDVLPSDSNNAAKDGGKAAAKVREEVSGKKAKEEKVEDKSARKASSESKGSAAEGEGSQESASGFKGVVGSRVCKEGSYQFPPLDLLRRPAAAVIGGGDDLQEKSKILENTLAQFGIDVKVMEVEQGPVITRYELLPAPGVKVNSIAALEDDLALAMKATTIRLIIPIPGKSAVGIEVPNSVTSLVCLRELVESQIFRSGKCRLPLALGKDTSGKPLVTDLTGMPHLLIAGTTGSGKTVCVNSIIAGLMYACSPEELKFVMIDPKMVELAIYKKIPHMLAPVVTDVRKAYHTLNWVVTEMENRYKLFATVGVRNIQGFNSRPVSEEALQEIEDAGESDNVIPAKLPYIVVIIDELADLMMVAQEKVESAITRLAQLSRAVGIHLILATQRPSVDVITGVIKANFPARISFKVASKVDSRTVLDTNGADQLIGKGDMLFIQPGDAKPTRGQAALVVDEEINAVVDFVCNQGTPDYHPEIQSIQEGKTATGNASEKDELFDEAVRIVLETGQASTSNLQRRMRLGYTRAARIIDQMEAEGIIGSGQGAKPRDILISRESPESISQN